MANGVLVGFKPAIVLRIGEARASGGARADGGTAPDPAANIREILAVILQPLVFANVPSISKKTAPSEGRTQWRLGPKRGLFGGRLGDGAYVPAGEPKHSLTNSTILNLGMKSVL